MLFLWKILIKAKVVIFLKLFYIQLNILKFLIFSFLNPNIGIGILMIDRTIHINDQLYFLVLVVLQTGMSCSSVEHPIFSRKRIIDIRT